MAHRSFPTLDLMSDVDRAFQALGEFVVAFQWVENKYREIGWFLLDPERKDWPPRDFRTESNAELLNSVTELYLKVVASHSFPRGREAAEDFVALRDRFHQLRRHRNAFVHSTYIEIKGGGDVLGYLRSDPKLRVDPDTGGGGLRSGVAFRGSYPQRVARVRRTQFRAWATLAPANTLVPI
jgi:hypothetical protein